MLPSLTLMAVLLAATVRAPCEAVPRLIERHAALPDGADPSAHRIYLPSVHDLSDQPLDPPQIEPGAGEYFPCAACPGGVSHWLLLDHQLDYSVVPGGSWCEPWCDLAPGDVVIEVTVRIQNDSDVDYWAWVGGSSYDAAGNRLTRCFDCWPTGGAPQQIPAGGTGQFTFHMRSDRAIALIRLSVGSSVLPPP